MIDNKELHDEVELCSSLWSDDIRALGCNGHMHGTLDIYIAMFHTLTMCETRG
jgi:hypothetical protein